MSGKIEGDWNHFSNSTNPDALELVIIIYAYFNRWTSSAIQLLLVMKDLLPSNLQGCL